jgi:hypothetical protein
MLLRSNILFLEQEFVKMTGFTRRSYLIIPNGFDAFDDLLYIWHQHHVWRDGCSSPMMVETITVFNIHIFICLYQGDTRG